MKGLLTRLFERRALEETNAQGLMGFLNGLGALWQSATGVTVTPESSLQSSAVYACTRLLADVVASLPLISYQRQSDGGKSRASNWALSPVLHDMPNPEMSSMDFWSTAVGHMCLWGNAYAEIDTNQAGDVSAVWPLRPDRTMPRRNRNTKLIEYVIQLPSETVVLPAERVMHIRAFGTSGLMGLSPIQLAKESIGLAMATEEFGARYFGNGATPGVVLKHPGVMSQDAYDRLKESWRTQHEGLTNAQRTAILEEGVTIEKIGIPPNDSQFLETRKFQIIDIARMFHIPPHMIGDLEHGASYASIEQMSLDFVIYTLRPWLVRLEKGIFRSLLTPTERKQYFVEFLVDGLLRGDLASRYAAYAVGRQWGWLSVNDIRSRENMNPIEGGDQFMVPLNMSNASGGGNGNQAAL